MGWQVSVVSKPKAVSVFGQGNAASEPAGGTGSQTYGWAAAGRTVQGAGNSNAVNLGKPNPKVRCGPSGNGNPTKPPGSKKRNGKR